MDLSWGLSQVTKGTTLWGSLMTSYCSPPRFGVGELTWRSPRYCAPPLVLRAIPKNKGNNDDTSSGGGDASKGSSSSDGRKSHHVKSNWRDFRAKMIEVEKAEANALREGEQAPEIKPLGRKWAHPLSELENGCILVATEALDGMHTFERTVVLLLSIGSRHPQDDTFGVIINRPLKKKFRQMIPDNSSELAKTFASELAKTFADCSLRFGGPLDSSTLLFRAGENMKHPGFEEVVPGLFFGYRNCLDEAVGLVKSGVLKPDDFRLFFGYSGWGRDQLREEIESEKWHVAACSLDLIHGAASDSSSENLWQEVLQLMGGHYAKLSRKPKNDIAYLVEWIMQQVLVLSTFVIPLC